MADALALSVRLLGRAGNPGAVGSKIWAQRTDGTSQSVELHAGSGYLSQSIPVAFFASPNLSPITEIRIRWPDGQQTSHEVEDQKIMKIKQLPQ